MGENRGSYRVLMGRAEGKRTFRGNRHRLEGNTKMDLQEVGWGCMVWIGLSRDRDRRRALVYANGLWGSIICGEFIDEPKISYVFKKDSTQFS
jgi:hypothetical protein